ncbi:hypothetical protein BKA69DRAFT_1043854 [Paraphysoderma sedebokerense]|nr:hypothetical protein BKA69DRAFT_1043854 [Paraphysoderma sedebokerense]
MFLIKVHWLFYVLVLCKRITLTFCAVLSVAPFVPPAALSGQVSPQSSFSAPSVYTPPPPPPSLTDTIVNAAVAGAVALKQSPIPDAISSTLSVGLNTVKSIDNQYGLKDRILNLGKASISKAVEIDNEYKLHQKLGTAMLTGLTALTQATMAYKNAPSYTDAKGLEPLNDYHSQQYGNSHYFNQQPAQVSYFTDLGGSAATTSYSQQLLSALPASQILDAARLLYK